jgi:hypothetical protein
MKRKNPHAVALGKLGGRPKDKQPSDSALYQRKRRAKLPRKGR